MLLDSQIAFHGLSLRKPHPGAEGALVGFRQREAPIHLSYYSHHVSHQVSLYSIFIFPVNINMDCIILCMVVFFCDCCFSQGGFFPDQSSFSGWQGLLLFQEKLLLPTLFLRFNSLPLLILAKEPVRRIFWGAPTRKKGFGENLLELRRGEWLGRAKKRRK